MLKYALEEAPCKVEKDTWAKVLPILRLLQFLGHMILLPTASSIGQISPWRPSGESDGYSIMW